MYAIELQTRDSFVSTAADTRNLTFTGRKNVIVPHTKKYIKK